MTTLLNLESEDFSRKPYQLKQSVFYHLTSTNALCKLLDIGVEDLKYITENKELYYFNRIDTINNKTREIDEPVERLLLIHRRLFTILSRIKLPAYLHSSKKGFSYISNAKVHSDSKEVFTCDLKQFFVSTQKPRIFSFFYHKMKCSPFIAKTLAMLCTNENNHLPIGSPISQLLAFWVNKSMFDELSQLAKKHKLLFSVYVDDMTFSGKKIPPKFHDMVWHTVYKYGYQLNRKKSRLYLQNQPREITGIIVRNGKLAISNRIHKKLYQMLETYDDWIDNGEFYDYNHRESLLGMLHFMVQFEPKYAYLIDRLKKGTFSSPITKNNLIDEIDEYEEFINLEYSPYLDDIPF